MKRFYAFLFILIALTLGTCKPIFGASERSVPKNCKVLLTFTKWMEWEVSENYKEQPKDWRLIQTTEVPLSEIEINLIDGADISPVLQKMISGNVLLWPHHPGNTSDLVPFQDTEVYPKGDPLSLHYTASRSMVLEGTTFTMKIPTDNPTEGEDNPTKADLRKSVILSLRRGNLIKKIDAKLGLDPRLAVLYDVASIVDRSTKNGIVLRDVSLLNNGSFWLPSHSINTMGHKVARTKNLEKSRDFWIENFIKPSGRAKALMLIRYGIQLKFPHLQNSLTEYDSNMNPKGRLAFRDMSDTGLVRQIAEVIAPDDLNFDLKKGYKVFNSLNPILGSIPKNDWFRPTTVGSLDLDITVGEKKSLAYDDDSARRIHTSSVEELEKIEIQEYINTVVTELNLKESFKSISALQKFLFSAQGLKAIRAYHKRS